MEPDELKGELASMPQGIHGQQKAAWLLRCPFKDTKEHGNNSQQFLVAETG